MSERKADKGHKANAIAPLLLILAFGVYPLVFYILKKNKEPQSEYSKLTLMSDFDGRIESVSNLCDWSEYDPESCGFEVNTDATETFFLTLSKKSELPKDFQQYLNPGNPIKKQKGSPKIRLTNGTEELEVLLDF